MVMAEPNICRYTGKAEYASMRRAESAARNFARALNRRSELASSLYGYRCQRCRHFHLTRDAEHDGSANTLLYVAPSEELQRWAFPPEPSVPQ